MTNENLYTKPEILNAVFHMADEICQCTNCCNVSFVGIQQNGVPLANMLADSIEAKTGKRPQTGTLDITMYRDDFGEFQRLPAIRETEINFDVNDKTIILVDDVLSTGRTIRAALDALTDFGRPGVIRLAVLVDRDDPEFPIRADFVGFKINAPTDRKIRVEFGEEPVIKSIPWIKK